MITKKQILKFVVDNNLSAGAFTRPIVDGKYIQRYEDWLKKSYVAEMTWMVSSKTDRLDIVRRFPWARSILVVLDNYYNVGLELKNGLKIASYTRGYDYHKMVSDKLKNVLLSICHIDPNIEGKIYVDTGPIMEKALAEQAGLGWIGKNGLLIGNKIGSFCVIGVLLLSTELEPDKPAVNGCGDCSLCLDACPNEAIAEPGLIDCRKCIAYLTIEKKGNFSEIERKSLNGWIYGCDICQDACPWNKKWAKPTRDFRYIEKKEMIYDYLELGINIKAGKFGPVFKNSAVERLKFKRFHRNIDAVLGNAEKKFIEEDFL